MSEPDRAFRAAVGELAQQAAILESTTAILLWGLAGVDQQVGRIALPNGMDRMVPIIRELLRLRIPDESLRNDTLRWCDRAVAVYKKRNVILHSVWIGPGDSSTHWRADLKPLGKARADGEMNADEVMAVAREMELAVGDGKVAGLFHELINAVPGPWSAG